MVDVEVVGLPEVSVRLRVSCDVCSDVIGYVNRYEDTEDESESPREVGERLVEHLEYDTDSMGGVVREVAHFDEDYDGDFIALCENCKETKVVVSNTEYTTSGGTLPTPLVEELF